MFLARLPDGAKIPQVYRLTPKEMTPDSVANFVAGYAFGTRKRQRRAWRYDSRKLRPQASLPGSGISAIDNSPEEACMQVRVFQIHEKYGTPLDA